MESATGVRWRRRGPVLVLLAMVLVYIVVFGRLTWAQQSNFGTFGFDMGIHDQGTWLLSRFKRPYVTVVGRHYIGHHVNLVAFFYVPFYWLGAGPHFLYLTQTIAMAAGAIPIWLLARDRFANPWTALPLAGAYLLYPSLQWINWWHFHPDALQITPLLFAYWFASRRQWRGFAISVAIALLCKEDAALAVVMLGLVVALFRWNRRMGLATAGAGAAWFLLSTKVLIPRANGGVTAFYEDYFPALGSGMGEIAYNTVRHPSRVVRLATEAERLEYYRRLLAPVGYLALIAAPVLLIAGPQWFVNVTSGFGYTHIFKYHYTSLLIVAIFLATVEACALLGRIRLVQWTVVTMVAVSAVVTNVAWSPSPLGRDYDTGIWAKPSDKAENLALAVSMVPGGAGVAASYNLVPHLTHRQHIYEWPNPFVMSNWLDVAQPPRPAKADYLVLDLALNTDQQPLLDRLIAPHGEFEELHRFGDVLVARRRGVEPAR